MARVVQDAELVSVPSSSNALTVLARAAGPGSSRAIVVPLVAQEHRNGLRAGADTELAQDARDVDAGGALGDIEPCGDLAVAAPLDQDRGDLALPSR